MKPMNGGNARADFDHLADLREAIIEGAVQRVRPKIMTASGYSHWAPADHVGSWSRG